MAYNLQLLIQILDQILHPCNHRRPNWILDPRKKQHIESFLAKAQFLNEIFENPSSVTCHAIRSLETRIRDAACRAQDVIQSHIADQLISKNHGGRIFISPPSLLQEFVDFGFQRIVDEMGDIIDRTDFSFGIASSSQLVREEDLNQPKSIVVGISQDLIQLNERLVMPQQSELEIIPIVGMGGIGKTTLARTLYNNQNVASWFDRRAWIVISQNCDEREILLGLLKCVIGKLSVQMTQDDNDRLGLHLYQNLKGRRYLIVLDDMWSSDAWDCVKMVFPDENNGSRILVTTREQSVANYAAGSDKLHHQMKFLNDIESWKLLRRKLFPVELCPSELIEVGTSIAKDCGGLPLAIHAVGGVLSQLDKTKETWIQVAKDVRSSMAKNYKQFSSILSLSYTHLPNYLKPCFLYMMLDPFCLVLAKSIIK